MEGISVSAILSVPSSSANDLANEMKNIHKGRLNRQVYEHPELAGKLVAMKASPVYNTRGDIIQAVSNHIGNI